MKTECTVISTSTREIDPGRAEEEANEYLVPRFPKLDFIKRTTFVQ